VNRRSLLGVLALSASGCGLIAGTGDFTDQPAGGGGGAEPTSSSGSGTGSSSSGGGASTSSGGGASSSSGAMTGGQGGTATSTGGDGGSASCLGCVDYVSQCYLGADMAGCVGTSLCPGQAQDAFNGLVDCICANCPNECQTSCGGQTEVSRVCQTCAWAAAMDPDLCQAAYSSCQQADGP